MSKIRGQAPFDLKYSNGTLGHEQLMRSIELYGTKVIPMAREMIAEGADQQPEAAPVG